MEQAPFKQTSKLRETFTTFAKGIIDKFPKRRVPALTEQTKKETKLKVRNTLVGVGGIGLFMVACGALIASNEKKPAGPQPTSVATYYLTPEATKLATPVPTPTTISIPTAVKVEVTPSPVAAPIVATRAVSESRGGPGSSDPEGVKVLNEALPYIRIVNAAYTNKLESGEVVHGVDNDYGESITIKGGNEKQIPFTVDTNMGQKYIAITNGGINKDSLFVKITTLGGDAEIDLKDKKALTFDQFLQEVKAQADLDKTLQDLKVKFGIGLETQLGIKPAYSSTYKYGDKGMWGFSDQEEPTTYPAKSYEEIYAGANTELRELSYNFKERLLAKDYYFLVVISKESNEPFFNLIRANNDISAAKLSNFATLKIPGAKNVKTYMQAELGPNGVRGFVPTTDKYGYSNYAAVTTFELIDSNNSLKEAAIYWKTSFVMKSWNDTLKTPDKTVFPDSLFGVIIRFGNSTNGIIGGKDMKVIPGTMLTSSEKNHLNLNFSVETWNQFVEAIRAKKKP